MSNWNKKKVSGLTFSSPDVLISLLYTLYAVEPKHKRSGCESPDMQMLLRGGWTKPSSPSITTPSKTPQPGGKEPRDRIEIYGVNFNTPVACRRSGLTWSLGCGGAPTLCFYVKHIVCIAFQITGEGGRCVALCASITIFTFLLPLLAPVSDRFFPRTC